MAVKLIMMRRGQLLAAADPQTLEELQKVPQGEIVSISMSRPRNLRHHMKFWKLMSVCFEMQSHYTDIEDMVDDLKIAIGHARKRKRTDGTEVWVPHSISFSSMDQSAFEIFYNRVVEVILKTIIPGVGREDFEAHVFSILDGKNYTELRR